jgi:hypothetical protein
MSRYIEKLKENSRKAKNELNVLEDELRQIPKFCTNAIRFLSEKIEEKTKYIDYVKSMFEERSEIESKTKQFMMDFVEDRFPTTFRSGVDHSEFFEELSSVMIDFFKKEFKQPS